MVAIPGTDGLIMEGQPVMNFEDRGSARLERILSDPERAERVDQIRQQMDADDCAYQGERERPQGCR